jgi:hypothetical protein
VIAGGSDASFMACHPISPNTIRVSNKPTPDATHSSHGVRASVLARRSSGIALFRSISASNHQPGDRSPQGGWEGEHDGQYCDLRQVHGARTPDGPEQVQAHQVACSVSGLT